jgi:hypothetical protein
VNFITKLLRRRRPAADAEAEAEAHRQRAEWETVRERQLALSGPRGIGGLPPTGDDTDLRR